MSQVWEFFQKLFDTAYFPPRWVGGYWTTFHVWLYIISDLLIWLAFLAIPVAIVRYTSIKRDTNNSGLYILFASFILLCGATHLLDALSFWYPFYRLNALILFVTAVVSCVTLFAIVQYMPVAFKARSSSDFEAEIEHRKRIENELQLNHDLLLEAQEIARLGHWQWDVVANRVEWSPMTLKLFGLNADKNNMDYSEYLTKIHPDDRDFVDKIVREALTLKVFPKFYHRILLPDGRGRTMLGRGQLILNSDGEVAKIIGTVQDVTEQRNAEHELMVKSQKLEASNLELQRFASIASHDLREPLRKIITFGTMLEKEYNAEIGDRGKMYLQKITGASSRMQKLIDDILDFSKLTGEIREFERVNLNEVINHVLNDMEVAIETTHARIDVDHLPEIDGKASQLGQMFQNLLGNAIKFRKPNEPPCIQIRAEIIGREALPVEMLQNSEFYFPESKDPLSNVSEQFCKIFVRDNGIGFDESFLERIFLIFQRLHNKGQVEGTGIGLAVVKKVVDAHYGYVTATSKEGEGATFMIILPLVVRTDAS